MSAPGLVLWDIDHTLVDGADLGPRIWGGAFERLTGSAVTRAFQPDGSTDPLIFRQLVALHELDDPGWHETEIEAAYRAAFIAVEADWRERARPKPGADDAIAALASAGGFVQSLLTGNVAANAAAKLRALGLDTYLDFAVGAYGDDPHEVRGDLVAVARERASRSYGDDLGRGERTVLIGDTPRDVEAAHAGGASVIAVATGLYSTADLTEAGADRVLADLTTLPDAVTAVLGAP